jgi:hypothetical protein
MATPSRDMRLALTIRQDCFMTNCRFRVFDEALEGLLATAVGKLRDFGGGHDVVSV